MPLVPVERGPLLGMLREFVDVDPDGASELIRLSLYEALADDVDRYGNGLREKVGKQLLRQQDATRRALVRDYVAKREAGQPVDDELRAAAYLAVTDTAIAKAWDPRKHPRNKAGRFVHELSGKGGPNDMKQEAKDAIISMKQENFLRNGSKVTLHGHLLDEDGQFSGSYGHQEVTADANLHNQIKSSRIAPTHLAMDAKQTNVPEGNKGTVFDVTSRLVGEKRGLQAGWAAPVDSPEQLKGALDTVMRDSSGTDRKAYRRMAATGQALQRFSTPGSGANTAGAALQMVGQFAPEAEDVLGRPIRRTAYRYRGTERKPNQLLVNEVADASGSADSVAAANENTDFRRQFAAETQRGRQGLAMGTAGYYAGTHEDAQRPGTADRQVDHTTDALDLRLRGDTAVGYFMRKLPTRDQYMLSLESGKLPPSQGAIIDSHGEVYTEAVGFGEDHYLPFDLKNLRALQGGQYVRTRAAGGPTTEDIYTGLLTGARQLQVVSNSGVFTVEFDPDLRGGRRYSDKARQMVGRYQKLIDRIQRNAGSEQQLMINDIPDDEKQALRQEAYHATGYHEQDAQGLYQQKLKRARTQAQFAQPSNEDLEAQANREVTREMNAKPGARTNESERRKQVAERLTELKGERDTNMVRALQLDGEGYARALSSLQQEFPYFIRSVDFETTREFDSSRRHTPPNRPHPAPDASGRRTDRGYIGGRNITTAEQRGARQEGGQPRTAPGATPNTPAAGGGGGGGSQGQQPRRVSGPNELADLGHTPIESGKLSDLKAQRGDIATQAADRIAELGPLGYEMGEVGPSDEERADPNQARTPKGFFMALAADPNQAKNRLNEVMKPENRDKRQLLAQGLKQLNDEVNSRAADEFDQRGHDLRQQYPEEKVTEALGHLQRLDAADQPFAEQAEDPALYAPEGTSAVPQHFDEIDRLGTNMENYETFYAMAETSGKAPFFSAGLRQLEPMNDVQRRDHIREEVRAYRNTVNWGKLPPGQNYQAPPKPGTTLTDDWGDARQMADDPNNQQRRQLMGLQQAWSFLHGAELAEGIGGGAGPKAQADPSSGQPSPHPQFSHQPPLEEQEKRLRPKVIVHPPGSPIAKALARKLATSRPRGARQR